MKYTSDLFIDAGTWDDSASDDKRNHAFYRYFSEKVAKCDGIVALSAYVIHSRSSQGVTAFWGEIRSPRSVEFTSAPAIGDEKALHWVRERIIKKMEELQNRFKYDAEHQEEIAKQVLSRRTCRDCIHLVPLSFNCCGHPREDLFSEGLHTDAEDCPGFESQED